MKVLELFGGTCSVANAFKNRGHEIFTVEWDEQHPDIDWYIDVNKITAQDILERFGKPEVIWASPDCSSYSVAAISHHRTREPNGNLAPVTDYARFCDATNQHLLELIDELNPRYYFIENPRGALRKMEWIQHIPRYTVWYCTYGDFRAKPTDIWTNHPTPEFKAPCFNGNKDCHHQSAPRGTRSGTQGIKGTIERSRIPRELCEHIVDICTQ